MAHLSSFTSTGELKMGSPTNSSKPGHSNTTNNATESRPSLPSGLASSEDEKDGVEADSEDNASHASVDDEADAEALSGVAKLTVEPNRHLAGNPSSDSLQDDDMMFLEDVDMMDMDDIEASAGAEDSDVKSLEDDDDYTGLDAISDDEDRSGEEIEKDMLKAAEADLRQEYLETETERTMQEEQDWYAEELNKAGYRSRNLSIASEDDDPFGLSAPLNLDEDPFQGAQLFDSEWQGLMDDAEMNLWRMPNHDRAREDSFQSTDRPKRVRFAEGAPLSRTSSRSSSGSSDDEADDAYPDIFMDQDDPKIQRLLAQDRGDGDMTAYDSDAGSVYDFEDDADRFAFEMDEESDSSEDDSDYDSDLSDDSEDGGYETEDETLEEKQAKMQEVCRMAHPEPAVSAPVSAPATPTASKRTPAPIARSSSTASASKPNKSKKGPREGTFVCDPTKATVVSDSTGKKTVLYMPTQPSAKNKAFWDRARSAASSRNTSPRGSMSIELPPRGGKNEQQARPFTAQSTLSTMFDGNFDFMSHTDMSPPPIRVRPQSAYTPAPSAYTTPAPTTEGGSDADEEYTDFGMLVDLDQESDEEDEGVWSAAVTSPMEPTFLSRGMVGSFRLNQHRAKQESSMASHPDSRASTSEINALQSGRRGAGNAPITPARKRRMSKDLNRTHSGIRKPALPSGSPLSARRPRSRGQSLSGRLDQTFSPGLPLKK